MKVAGSVVHETVRRFSAAIDQRDQPDFVAVLEFSIQWPALPVNQRKHPELGRNAELFYQGSGRESRRHVHLLLSNILPDYASGFHGDSQR